jgi:hypothetical protein
MTMKVFALAIATVFTLAIASTGFAAKVNCTVDAVEGDKVTMTCKKADKLEAGDKVKVSSKKKGAIEGC